MVGTKRADRISGLAGNDTIRGLGRGDTINGNDTLYGREGTDTLKGQGGRRRAVGRAGLQPRRGGRDLAQTESGNLVPVTTVEADLEFLATCGNLSIIPQKAETSRRRAGLLTDPAP